MCRGWRTVRVAGHGDPMMDEGFVEREIREKGISRERNGVGN